MKLISDMPHDIYDKLEEIYIDYIGRYNGRKEPVNYGEYLKCITRNSPLKDLTPQNKQPELNTTLHCMYKVAETMKSLGDIEGLEKLKRYIDSISLTPEYKKRADIISRLRMLRNALDSSISEFYKIN